MTADEIEFFKSIAGGREPPTQRVPLLRLQHLIDAIVKGFEVMALDLLP